MNFVIALDYDGTLFTGSWDTRGDPVVPVVMQAIRFCDNPHYEVILWTCREETLLVDAVRRCEELGIKFDAVNMNTDETLRWNLLTFGRQGHTSGRKVYADLYVDDKSPGSIDHFLSLDPEVEWLKVADRKIKQ